MKELKIGLGIISINLLIDVKILMVQLKKYLILLIRNYHQSIEEKLRL